MEYIFAVVVGFILGKWDKINFKKVYDFLATPTDNKLELDWTLREIFSVFSINISERWYEARTHLNQSVFTSLLCALGLINIIQISYGSNEDGVYPFVTFKTHGFRSYDNLKEYAISMIDKKRKNIEEATYYERTFIAGYNVIHSSWG